MAIRSIAHSDCATLPLVALVTLLLVAMVAPTSAQEPTEDKAESRLAPMTRRAEQLKIRFADSADRAAPELMKSPVLRTNDPTRSEVDGAVWLWLDGKRPVAVLGVMYYASGKWNYELSSMTDEALEVAGRPTWTWKPPAAKRDWIVVDEPVPDALRARQLALRTLPRRFDASEVRRGERFPLHLLNQPIYTYADPDRGLIDGAVFAISY